MAEKTKKKWISAKAVRKAPRNARMGTAKADALTAPDADEAASKPSRKHPLYDNPRS